MGAVGREEREGKAAPKETPEIAAVADAYRQASQRPVTSKTVTGLKRDAAVLLAAGLPVEWIAARAAEMPARGWVNLQQHVERSTEPLPGQRTGSQTPEERRGLPPWCGQCGDFGLNQAARVSSKWRTLGESGSGERCPRCHPDLVAAA
ncbi:hypothetical protein GCM10010358_74120 [Streptomyces minutiscleroticus]|uniref:Uncharacterized protein n=1 Tax=Streptomyces minutiscleroticus TaxID=68238 RepID=A0A918P0S1_9ACTN|nr:hypothetical protein GCM10010358_74120 [Streptomyces minutiscleroticus]